VVVGITILQGLWYALSLQPTLFDEPKHLGRIFFYAQHLSPFLGTQDPSWDSLGAITRDGSYLFYYLMSLPLRFFQLFIHDTRTLDTILRVICLSFFVGGLVFFRKALVSLKAIPGSAINLILLFIVLTPAIAPLVGAVNYDSPVFLIFAIILWLAIRIIQSKKLRILDILSLLSLVLVMSIIKWTSIALSIPTVLYLGYVLYRRYGKKFRTELVAAAKKAPRVWFWVAVAGLVFAAVLFIERPVMNTVLYGQPEADCPRVIGYDRCLKFPDYAIYAEIGANKPANFAPKNPLEYLLVLWIPGMINSQVGLLSPPFPLIQMLFFVFALGGVTLFLVYFRTFMRSEINRFFLVIIVGYILLLFIYLYRLYLTYAIPAAINGRYLIPILPLLFYFVFISVREVLKKRRKTQGALLVIILLGFTQGGGIITDSLTSNEAFYWRDDTTRGINSKMRSVLHRLVKEK